MAAIRQPLDPGHTRNVPTHNVFNVENVIKMLPKGIDSDVESFLQAFERLAFANDWPENKYLTIIQTQFSPNTKSIRRTSKGCYIRGC